LVSAARSAAIIRDFAQKRFALRSVIAKNIKNHFSRKILKIKIYKFQPGRAGKNSFPQPLPFCPH
jgi:hypothetical protein